VHLKVRKVRPGARLPAYQHPGDAGLDLFSAVDEVLAAGELKAVPTGLQLAVPEGHAGLI
jgi:dUTP pyrophosphatase